MKTKHYKLVRVLSVLGIGMLAAVNVMGADIEVAVYPGNTGNGSTSVTLPALPPAGDILFSFDVTGSMGGVIDTTKSNAVTLMASLEATGVSFHFGVSSFADYPATYSSCGYSATYGTNDFDGMPSDYPYRLDQPMTTNLDAVTAAIAGLEITPGMDGPEAYTRPLYESYADTNVMWRSGAKRIMVQFGDSVPHDCNINAGIPGKVGTYSTGGDPGRDGIMGTSDDLVLLPVLAGMASNHVMLLAARVSSFAFTDYYFPYWTNWTAITGGKAFQSTNTSLINDLMHEITNSLAVTCVNNLHPVVDPPAFSSWLKFTPPNYATICSGDIRTFGVAITPPVGTPGGDYSMTIRMLDDMAVDYADRTVLVHVIPPVTLPVALNNSNLVWATQTGTPWFGQTNVSHDGYASGRSFAVGDGQQSVLTTTTNGPGTLSFWWKVSSQTNADTLSFLSYGGGTTNVKTQISGEAAWQQVSVLLPGGPQTLVWTYAKNASQSAGLDAGFVDQVSYVPGATLPYIITDPVSQAVAAGTPVTFWVVAGGTPRLSYQWRLNASDVAGATSTAFTLPVPSFGDRGVYSVRVSSPYGATNSADAYLTIIPLLLRGNNSMGQSELSLLATNPVAIAAGSYHTLALMEDSTVVAWGENTDGQCTPPAGLADVVQVAGGGYHSLALRADGSVAAWGSDVDQQCDVPANLSNVVAVAAGFWHTLALRSDGTVVGWGDNSYGQTAVPSGLNQVVAIAGGGNHSLALRADGKVFAWGDNLDAYGNVVGQSRVPVNLNGVKEIGAGDYHSLAVLSNGTVVAWGDNSEGQCQVPANLTTAVAVVGGGSHCIALKADSSIAAWGNDWDHQCNFPTNLFGIAAVAAGEDHSVALVGLAQPKLMRAKHTGNRFSVCLPTYAGKNYALQYATSPNGGAWTPASTAFGYGGLQTLVDPAANSSPRFYRVRVW